MERWLRIAYQHDGAGGGGSTETPPEGATTTEATPAGGDGGKPQGDEGKGAEGGKLPGWTAGLKAENREAAAKVGPTVNHLWDAYVASQSAAEKAKGGVKVPGANASTEEIATYRKAIGVPDSPENYKLERPKLPDGMPYDEGLEKLFRAEIHKMGVPAPMATGLYNLWNRVMVESAESRRKAVETSLTTAKAEIIKEIGEDEFKRRDAHANSLMEWSGLAEVLRTAETDAGVKKKGFEAAWKLAGLISPATLDKASGGRQPGADTGPTLNRLPVLPKDHPKATRR